MFDETNRFWVVEGVLAAQKFIYMVLSGTAMMNERNRIIDILQEQNTNIGFFAAADDSETKRELTERIGTMWKKYTAISEPTPMILENMRQETKQLTDDVNEYLKSLNQ